MDGDIHNRCWFSLLARLFVGCVVKVRNGATTIDNMCCVVLLLLCGMKRAELVSASQEDVFHVAYGYAPRGRSVGPGEPAPLPLECSSLQAVNKRPLSSVSECRHR